MSLDPILLEILCNKAEAATAEMSATLQRTSRTLYVKEAADFACALVSIHDGKFFAFPRTSGVTIFLDLDCSETIRAVPDLEPGDVIITNHPYQSGGLATHMPDIHMVRPYFHDGRIVGYGWCFIHSTDIGGRVPSSISPSNREIFQEGLLIPPLKIAKRGELNKDLIAVYRSNCRTPDANMGDIKAMLASLRTGAQRVADMIEQHGLGTFLDCQEELQAYSATKAQAVLRRIPNGEYVFWDYLDDDIVSPIPLRVRVRLVVKDGTVHLDLTGTDPQVAAAFNVPTGGTRHTWLTMRLLTLVCTHDKSVPLNAGIFRPVSVTNPPGTVLHAEFPDAVGVRHGPARRLNDALTGALLKAAPELMAAPTCGANAPVVLAEPDTASGNRNVLVLEPLWGGMGAWRGHDGVDGRDSTMSNMRNHPVEIVEQDAGVVVHEYGLRPDSGGAGQWRGGVGQVFTFEVLKDGSSVQARGMERFRFPPWGVAGGKPSARMRCVRNLGRTDEQELDKLDELFVNAGDTVTFMLPGASGFGDSFRRDPEAVLHDVRLGFVSHEAAERDYGVVIADGRVDAKATERARATRVRDNFRADFDFGPEREAWEAVFDDATMLELNRRLYALPKAVRNERRRRIFFQALPGLGVGGGRAFLDLLAEPEVVKARLLEAMDRAFGHDQASGQGRGRAAE